MSAPPMRRPAPAKHTTAFVSAIPPEIEDRGLERLLMMIGRVRYWKRVKDQAGALKSFGFCEFEDAESVLRALRLLPQLPINGKPLQIKVDDNTRRYLDHEAEFAATAKPAEGVVDDATVLAKAVETLQELGFAPAEAPRSSNPSDAAEPGELPTGAAAASDSGAAESRAAAALDADKRPHGSGADESSSRRPDRTEEEKETARRRERERPSDRGREREPDRGREREREPDRGRERERDSDASARDRGRETDRDRRLDYYETERQKEERRTQEVDQAFRERLRRWQTHEYERERTLEREREREAERLKRKAHDRDRQLAELADPAVDRKDDYAKDRDKWLVRRKREREREAEEDERDRVREKAEAIEAEAKRKAEEVRLAAERERLEREAQEAAARAAAAAAAATAAAATNAVGGRTASDTATAVGRVNLVPTVLQGRVAIGGGGVRPATASASAAPKRPAVFAAGADADEDDAAAVGQRKKRLLIPIEYSEEEMATVGVSKEEFEARRQEARRKRLQAALDAIPTQRDALFATPVQWDLLSSELMDDTLRPWVSKKMAEYLGEDDVRMVDHVLAQVNRRVSPSDLVEALKLALDREAEGFVVKLWRMVVFESERMRVLADE